MLRTVSLAAMIAAGLLLAAPFVLSSRYVDERGVDVPGRVFSKREFISVRHSGWERTCEVTIIYRPPDEPGESWLVARLEPASFDHLRKGGLASVRYLRRQDLPRVPMAEALRNMHLLPAAHAAGEAGVDPDAVRAVMWLAVGALLLVCWRVLQWPGFPWAVAAGVAILLVIVLESGFPRPVPEPRGAVRTAYGRVASIDRIAWLFSTNRSRGVEARQPVQVVAVEFVPSGTAEPVVAVDLIDEGSIPGLARGTPVAVVYEEVSPRTARVEGGTREFPVRNRDGAIAGAALGVGLFLGLFALLALAGRAAGSIFRRLLSRA